jgi:hypothetical protein
MAGLGKKKEQGAKSGGRKNQEKTDPSRKNCARDDSFWFFRKLSEEGATEESQDGAAEVKIRWKSC